MPGLFLNSAKVTLSITLEGALMLGTLPLVVKVKTGAAASAS
jgi:hypothetical protein